MKGSDTQHFLHKCVTLKALDNSKAVLLHVAFIVKCSCHRTRLTD